MKTKLRSGIKVKAAIKAGGFYFNHTRSGLKVKSGTKAGGSGIWQPNHNLVILHVA